jgi:colanic acid biosynthesis glycosyl transferase WcaI
LLGHGGTGPYCALAIDCVACVCSVWASWLIREMVMGHQMNKSRQYLDILVYGMNYAPECIGVGRYTGDIGNFLNANGHHVRVVAAPPHYPEWVVNESYPTWSYTLEFLDGVAIVRCPIFLMKKIRGIGRLLAPLSFALSSAPVVVWSILRR